MVLGDRVRRHQGRTGDQGVLLRGLTGRWTTGYPPSVPPTPAYTTLLDTISRRLPEGALGPSILLIDGIPASGKSSLAAALREHLRAEGRTVEVVENDWFIAPSIRSPWQIARGLLLATSGRPVAEVERALLDTFLDGDRLGALQADLARAAAHLERGESVEILPQGAHHNLARPRPWDGRSLHLRPGAVVIVEGTLCRAAWLGRFPAAFCVFVEVPIPDARLRFLRRNAAPPTRRNRAFSLLARVGPAYRLSAEMIGRDRHAVHLRVDLSDLDAPRLMD